VAETANLKSLARKVFERDTCRDTVRDGASQGCLAEGKPPRQGPTPVSAPAGRVPGSYSRCLAALREGCPDLVDERCWQRAVEDGCSFLAQWGDQAHALGWTAWDLFGLHSVPDKPAPNYRRLSRYEETGLIWLLRGRPVVALAEGTAAIENPTGATTVYRKNNKPALGPVGDTLDDLDPSGSR
jgi:hypothetical protein